jgi:transcriptional regulator with XRE-family HTH domain
MPTQKQMAAELGISDRTVRRILNGEGRPAIHPDADLVIWRNVIRSRRIRVSKIDVLPETILEELKQRARTESFRALVRWLWGKGYRVSKTRLHQHLGSLNTKRNNCAKWDT